MLPRPLAQAVGVSAKVAQGESEFIRMRGRPGNDPFELRQVVPDGADLNQLCFDDLWISHSRYFFFGSPAV